MTIPPVLFGAGVQVVLARPRFADIRYPAELAEPLVFYPSFPLTQSTPCAALPPSLPPSLPSPPLPPSPPLLPLALPYLMSFDNVKGKGKGSVPSNAGSSSLYEEDVKDYDDKHGGSEGSSPEASPVSEAHHHDWVNASGKNVVVGHYIQKYKHENTIALYAIGLRGFVMFPYCMAHYGGGAFLLVFSFMLVVLGITGALLEMSWGQALNQAMPRVFDDIHPRWAGATASAAVALMLLLCSSTLLVGYSGVYFFACFRMQDVPWQGKAGEFWVEGMHGSFTLPLILSLVGVCATQGFAQLSPSFTRNVTLLLPFPLVVLAMTFIRGLSLDGAKEGLGWLFAFSFADVGSSTTWAAAAGQVCLGIYGVS